MEILAKWMIKHGYATGHGDYMEDLLEELQWQIEERSQRAIEVEREACAKVCDKEANLWNEPFGYALADAIRARGHK